MFEFFFYGLVVALVAAVLWFLYLMGSYGDGNR